MLTVDETGAVNILTASEDGRSIGQITVTSIGGSRYLTAAHVLDDEWLGEDSESFRLAARGALPATFVDDWAIIELPTKHHNHPPLNLTDRVSTGDEVLVAGFTLNPAAGKGLFTPVIERGHVARRPRGLYAPAGTIVFCVDGPTYEGMSGGPVLRWQEERARWELIGIYLGKYTRGERQLFGAAQLLTTPGLAEAIASERAPAQAVNAKGPLTPPRERAGYE